MLRMFRLPVALAFVAVALALTITSVWGHAEYDRSEPTRNAVLASSPPRVDVFFVQDVRKVEGENYVRVFNEADEQVSVGDGVVDDDDRRHIVAEFTNPPLPDGRYVVRWRTLSDADGDDDEGAFCFYVNADPTDAQRAECALFDSDQGAPTATAGAAGPTATQEAAPSATPRPATATPEPAVTPTVVVSTDDDGGSIAGLIIAIVVGVVVVVAAGGGAYWWWRRRQAT